MRSKIIELLEDVKERLPGNEELCDSEESVDIAHRVCSVLASIDQQHPEDNLKHIVNRMEYLGLISIPERARILRNAKPNRWFDSIVLPADHIVD